ncbi:DUF6215 domain-containing protein [Streptomyces brasiliensis]|uniref:Uncharacterized protein n=1 Tax=Streptomyces brasiliensis TaxID=1954 RepID=A0A917NJI1_9ACTN|nr:DUF6215 domain-containing protein [Streptomyces brasiliensis]GGJ05501.1 hypothetical protein GCM10010121_014910 [Streptomyces brasiliensis]
MTEGLKESGKGMSAGAQAVAAVVVVGGVLGGMWGLGEVSEWGTSTDPGPAACEKPHGTKSLKPISSPKIVSGAQLCTALNLPDLPGLLGTPTEYALNAYGSDGFIKLAGGTKIASPEANVQLDTYSVKLSASDDHLPIGEYADLLGTTVERRTILGHPAVLYSDRTIAISFHDGKAATGPGGIARSLLVARDAKDGGGSFEIDIWRQDAVPPDDTALLWVAEKVLPRIPGWTAV